MRFILELMDVSQRGYLPFPRISYFLFVIFLLVKLGHMSTFSHSLGHAHGSPGCYGTSFSGSSYTSIVRTRGSSSYSTSPPKRKEEVTEE